MSLFDIIKYPISVPPTPAELEALPTSIYNPWVTIYFGIAERARPSTAALYLDRMWRARRGKDHEDGGSFEITVIAAVNKLRRMIAEAE